MVTGAKTATDTEGSVSVAPSACHPTPYETTDGQGTELSALRAPPQWRIWPKLRPLRRIVSSGGTDGHRFSFGTTIWYPIPASQVDRHDVENRRESIATLRRQGNTWQAVALSVGLSPSRARAVHAACAPPSPSPDDTALLHNLRAFVLQHPSGSRRAYGAWSSRLASPATVVTRFGSWTEAIVRALQDDVRAVVIGDGRDQSNVPEHRV